MSIERNLYRAAFCLMMVLPAGAAFSATVLFEDTFDVYVDDTEVTNSGWEFHDENSPVEMATWTITNSHGRLNPPIADGSPSIGLFLISDSDHVDLENPTCSGMSHDLWTPIIDCTAAEKVWLHMEVSAQLNNNGKAVFDVDVSIDDGGTWQNVYRTVSPSRVECDPKADVTNADGFFGQLDVDLTDPAAHEPSVRIRLRHFEPNDDWWIAVDDFLVDDVAPTQGGQFTLLPQQTFLAGIPATWTVRSALDPPNDGNRTWNTNDPFARSVVGKSFPHLDGRGVHRLGSEFAIFDVEATPGVKDDVLLTPVLDCSTSTEVFLHVRNETAATKGAVQEILVSFNGGFDFETPPTFSWNPSSLVDNAEEPFYSEDVFAVPAAAGKPSVVFGFRVQGSGDEGYWAIDDVKITANGTFDARACENRDFKVVYDPSTNQAAASWKRVAGDEGFRLFEGARQAGGDLAADAVSAVDAAPPAGGNVKYKLQVLAGGQVERECESEAINTFACPTNLACTLDKTAKTVTLGWKKAVNLKASLVLRRNGQTIATLDSGADSHVDTVDAGVNDYELAVVPDGGANPGQCPGELFCRAYLPGDVILFDDFEAYADDAALETAGWLRQDLNQPVEQATWTITNPGQRANPPSFDGIPTTGKFVISDSDHVDGSNPTCSGMSHDLWSPVFDCTGETAVWLHMDVSAQLNNNGKAVFDVDVTTNGGGSWENVVRQAAPERTDCEPLVALGAADGSFGRLHVDLSAHAAGKPAVRVRLRHFEPNDDWWIAVDNFQIDSTAGSAGEVALLANETFDGGIPATWTVRSGLPEPAPWNDQDTCLISLFKRNGGIFPDGQGLHHFEETYAIADPVCSLKAQDEYLISPAVDAGQVTQVFLEVKSATLMKTGVKAEILLSLDGGTTFEKPPVFSYNPAALFDSAEDPFYNAYFFAVPRAAGQSSVAFAFHYTSAEGVGSWWAIDDVQVSGSKAAPPSGFRRGDCSGNNDLDITDAIFDLNYLFLAGDAPPCEEACNSSGDEAHDLTDPIYLLNYLFLAGPAPPAPGGEACGRDPEPGPLTCATPTC